MHTLSKRFNLRHLYFGINRCIIDLIDKRWSFNTGVRDTILYLIKYFIYHVNLFLQKDKSKNENENLRLNFGVIR